MTSVGPRQFHTLPYSWGLAFNLCTHRSCAWSENMARKGEGTPKARLYLAALSWGRSTIFRWRSKSLWFFYFLGAQPEVHLDYFYVWRLGLNERNQIGTKRGSSKWWIEWFFRWKLAYQAMILPWSLKGTLQPKAEAEWQRLSVPPLSSVVIVYARE